jgi:hypothetical protein
MSVNTKNMKNRQTYLIFYLTGSNHFGIAGWYGLYALKHGMI